MKGWDWQQLYISCAWDLHNQWDDDSNDDCTVPTKWIRIPFSYIHFLDCAVEAGRAAEGFEPVTSFRSS